MTQLINQDQKGFIKGRCISFNIRKILDLLSFTDLENTPAWIVSIDFEKCFERIEHQCIYGALEFFGFGNNFIRMVQTTYNEFSACVQCNGNFSPYFNMTRSVHQGGPNSSYLIPPLCRAFGYPY